MKTWFAYAQLLRLPNVFTALADILLAFAASYVPPAPPWRARQARRIAARLPPARSSC